MKATELQIGDWVYVSKNFTQKYHKIRELSNDDNTVLGGTYVNKYGVENNSVFQQNDTEPIPITPEILEKNGFKKTKRYSYIYKDNYCEVCVSIVPKIKIANIVIGEPHENVSINGALFDINMMMTAIHKLQQALRLCGIEKEIIL